jgi:hypothetical protein
MPIVIPRPEPAGSAEHEADASDEAVKAIVAQGPSGTWAVAGVATLVVMVIYFLFYFLAYLPRGAVQ